MSQTNNSCIVCGAKTDRLFDWSQDTIQRTYQEKVPVPFPKEAAGPDYVMRKCGACDLVFSDPPVPGNGPFYGWVTQAKDYYRGHRWEWGVIAELIRREPKRNLLEIGCGTGNFLKYIAAETSIAAVGLDTHMPSVEQCLSKGLNAKCIDLADLAAKEPDSKYDVVCAFHCLEHVSDPLDLVRTMKQLLAPGGMIVITVPYSPTSLDGISPDCLNLPPHHLTQWNARSLNMLARQAGLAADISTDEGIFGASPLKSAWWYYLSAVGGANKSSLSNLFGILPNLGLFRRCLSFALNRDQVAGRPAGDVAFAVFRHQQ